LNQQSKYASQQDVNAPIVVGGIGGSGTRVIASILEDAGVYMGFYHNPEMDSGFFGRMIAAYPQLWKSSGREIFHRLDLFAKLHLGKPVSPGEVMRLFRYVQPPKFRQLWLHFRRAYPPQRHVKRYVEWGFKHPCVHFYLNQLSRQFSTMRYIHVVRHGLDMAFSQNNHQLLHWGNAFYIDIPSDQHLTASMRLDFWIAVNQWVLTQCPQFLPERYYVLNFDKLCVAPEDEITKLMAFLQIEPESPTEELANIVQRPPSSGRYKGNLSLFTEQQIQAVEAFGFNVER
jgi:Sulfotransferase family